MDKDEIIEMAKLAKIGSTAWFGFVICNTAGVKNLETFAKLVEAKVEARYMQLFLDPENQTTQFGTATQEYREQDIAEIRNLLFAFANLIRTTHLYGPEVRKMLEQEEAIRARGEA